MATARDIVVVGGGVVGLCAGIRLREAGLPARIVAARPASETTSTVAPALFTPYPGAAPARLMGWVRGSLDALHALEREHPEAGVHTAAVRWYKFSERSLADGPWEPLLNVREAPVPSVPAGIAPPRSVEESDRPHLDTTRYLPWLQRRFAGLGGTIERREVESIESLHRAGARVVVNCAGLGAGRLVPDGAMLPLRGIVARVPNTIGVTRSVHDDAPGGKVAYVFVYRDHLAVGSTFEAGVWEERIDGAEVEAMFERARGLLCLDGVARWRELSAVGAAVRVGLRPARAKGDGFEDIRLEREERPSGVVVHDYGHGRSGVTLSWGCAAEVVELVRGVS